MDNIEAILAPEVLAAIVAVAALAMAVRALLSYSKDNAEISPKLDKIERDLSRLRDGMKDQKEAVDELNTVVQPIASVEQNLREYYEHLKKTQMDHERREAEATQAAEAERKGRIQRKRMGFEG